MKIHIGFDGQTFESTRREENSSQESLGPKLSEVLVTTNVANSFLTLVNCFELQGTIALFEAENLVHEAIVLRSPKQGIIISTSGSQGERRWIFHPWSNLIKRIQSLLKFLEICSQALLFAKEMGIEKARTVVHMDNPGAEFIHEALGFTKTPTKYKVWTNKIL